MRSVALRVGCCLLLAAGDGAAQFQLPSAEAEPETGKPPRPLSSHLTYQYGYGSESVFEYRRDRDLDKRLRDNSTLVTPQVNGLLVYRPDSWLELTLEMIMEKEYPVHEEATVRLPTGETVVSPNRHVSIPIDQLYALVRLSPVELAVGRRNYEDERHWLYDSSLDIASIALRQGLFRVEALGGRQVRWDMDLAPHTKQVKDRINTYILYADWRGIEDHRLAAYTIVRNDLSLAEGKARLWGARILGAPSDNLNYWVEAAMLRGTDELKQKFDGAGTDVGFTYRFPGIPFGPSLTLGYAFGTGDGEPGDGRNKEFRQSGLQSNETRFAGVAKFKIYGEVLDPELSNLEIRTAALGVRLLTGVTLDVVHHRYRTHKIADSVRNWALTAQMNQDDVHLSRDVGSAWDIVLGFRSLFGVKRLGVDVRAGRFNPGRAFANEEGDAFIPANRGYAVVAKLWW